MRSSYFLRPTVWIAFALFALALAAYAPLCFGDYQFLNVDDDEYVTDNLYVREGLSPLNVWWALTAYHSNNWHPLTWMSLQVDAQLFGLNPRAFHTTNVLLHAANTLLVFVVLQQLTGAVWRSFFVAAFFGVHPLRVESIAWIAERKDVLSTFFWLLTLWTYAAYARRPGAARYLLVLVLFVLGLMAKPMVVTLPFVLLLIDWWPLRRWGKSERRAAPEKLPFFLLTAVSCLLTIGAQNRLIV